MCATRVNEKNLMDRISIRQSLLRHNKVNQFLKQVVTGDEKWITDDNVNRKRSLSNRDELP